MPKKSDPLVLPAPVPSPPNLFVGTSGWSYPSWKPAFYPKAVPSRSFLPWYATQLTAVEVNFTFRKLPTPGQLQGWLDAAPGGFRFSFKAPQRITHFARLRNCADQVEQLFEVLEPARAQGKSGPILFQLPPNFQANPDLLEAFLNGCDSSLRGGVRIAFEFRHPSWFSTSVYQALRHHGAGLCIADTDTLATPDIHTAAFSCYRLRRDGGYTPAELHSFAHRFTTLAQGRETYVFLRHQEEPTGALNALELLRAARGIAPHTSALSAAST